MDYVTWICFGVTWLFILLHMLNTWCNHDSFRGLNKMWRSEIDDCVGVLGEVKCHISEMKTGHHFKYKGCKSSIDFGGEIVHEFRFKCKCGTGRCYWRYKDIPADLRKQVQAVNPELVPKPKKKK